MHHPHFLRKKMTLNGWIKLHRKLSDWEWYQDSQMVHFFIHCLLKANHRPNKWKGKTIKTGQFITGRKILAEETGISPQSIRTCIKRLKSTSTIRVESTSKYSLLTVCNYSRYQIEGMGDQPARNGDRQLTSNQQPTTTKEVKKGKKAASLNIETQKAKEEPADVPLTILKNRIPSKREVPKPPNRYTGRY